jgi:hypothetical protein
VSLTAQRLYALLPQVYRLRDAETDGALRELVEVIAEQVAVLQESLDQSYDDLFIETCADWVAPYLGDLIGYQPLHGVVPRVASPRAEVANTIRYRRRKGTASMLEQLARDVTGWPARAVEFFERLAVSQYMNHARPGRGGAVDLRRTRDLDRVGGPFDDFAHTAEVRRIGTGAGRYNIPNVGIFLWRTNAVPLTRVPLTPVGTDGRRFRFDQLGTDQPLYARPRTEEEITHLAEPFDVPLALSRRWLSAHLDAYYGGSLFLEVDGGTVPATVTVCDLRDSTGGWAHEPASGTVAIDPVLGRVWFGDTIPGNQTALGSVHYGSALEVGAGGHDRGDPARTSQPPVTVARGADPNPALLQVRAGGTVEITDSWRYDQTPDIKADADATVTVRSANRQRPLLAATGPVTLDAAAGSTVVLDGLLLTGGALVLPEAADTEARTLVLRHCTLVPGLTRTADGKRGSPDSASLLVLHPFADVTIERCVLGPVIAVEGARVTVTDSVIDAGGDERIAYTGRAAPSGGGLRTGADDTAGDGLTPGGALTLDECTVIGRVHALRLDISNSILVATRPGSDKWAAPVWARRRQVGCARFSYLPPGSRTGPRYRCQPTAPEIRPHFTSLRFGDPGYAQLRLATADAIRRGADDEGEMGAAHRLFQPQREANLRTRLDEYLRFGLEAGVFYAS